MRWKEIIESFKNDIRSDDAKELDPDFNLTIDDFVKEQAKLVATFYVADAEIVKTIRDYTKNSQINGYVIAGKTLSAKDQAQFDDLLRLKRFKFKLGEQHHVYSGTSLFDPLSIIKNGMFKTPAFTSTSLNISVAAKTNNFRREKKKATEDHILHFVLPAGYDGCFYLGPYSMWPAELEMLIFPKQKFNLVSSRSLEIDGITRHIHTLKPA